MSDQADRDAIIDLTDEVERLQRHLDKALAAAARLEAIVEENERLQKLNEKLTVAIRWWVSRCHELETQRNTLESWQEDVLNLHPELGGLEPRVEVSTCIVGGHAPTCRCHEGGPKEWEGQR